MALIRRNITRVAKNSTEITSATDTPTATTAALALQTTDALYLAYKKPFTTRYFAFGTANVTAATLSVYYWNGTTWAAVLDLIDQTTGFTADGFISWENQTDWQTKETAPFADQELYWIKIVPSTNLHASTTIQAILNIFTDVNLLSAMYPDLVSDTRYLPSGLTSFINQYITATDMVVNRLKKDEAITDESQIIDLNEVAQAATHFAAWAILFPIANDEEQRQRAKDCLDAGHSLLNKLKMDIDVNDDGIIDTNEENISRQFFARV